MRLTFRKSIGSLRLRRYEHERHGVVETLTQDTVVYVRPVFGLLEPEMTNERQGARPLKKVRRRLGQMWPGKASGGANG